MKRLNRFFKYFLGYLSIAGLVTFSMFICEEAFQTAMFGTWPAKDAKAWHIVKRGIAVMRSANNMMKLINYTVGYIQPIAFFAYRAYGKSADYYIEALTAEVMANAPHLYVDEKVQVSISGKGYRLRDGNREYKLGKITVILPNKPVKNSQVTGTLQREDNHLILKVE